MVRGHSPQLGLDLCWDAGRLRFYDPVAGRWLLNQMETEARADAEQAAREFAESHAESERVAREAAEAHAESERVAREAAEAHAESERAGREFAESRAESERAARESAEALMAAMEAELRRLRGG
jgi:hypothetical protein